MHKKSVSMLPLIVEIDASDGHVGEAKVSAEALIARLFHRTDATYAGAKLQDGA